MLPPLLPDPVTLAVEVATAAQVVAERPAAEAGRTRPAGQGLADWLANVAYWRLYEAAGCPPKLTAQSDAACRQAWIRLRAAVDLGLQQQAPKVAGVWVWPLASLPRRWTGGGSFGVRRPWSKSEKQTRYHCGVDLGAQAGVAVLAPEAGTVISGDHGWETKKKAGGIVGVKAIVLRAGGRTVLLGGIRPGSGLVTGTQVSRGQEIAKVGVYPGGSSMLHVQLWEGDLTLSQVIRRQSWRVGDPRPEGLSDPAPLLRPILEAAPQAFQIADEPDENVEQDEGTAAGSPATISLAQLLGALLGGKAA